jgi:hypothetical protein
MTCGYRLDKPTLRTEFALSLAKSHATEARVSARAAKLKNFRKNDHVPLEAFSEGVIPNQIT